MTLNNGNGKLASESVKKRECVRPFVTGGLFYLIHIPRILPKLRSLSEDTEDAEDALLFFLPGLIFFFSREPLRLLIYARTPLFYPLLCMALQMYAMLTCGELVGGGC